jgi:hypothetical protein
VGRKSQVVTDEAAGEDLRLEPLLLLTVQDHGEPLMVACIVRNAIVHIKRYRYSRDTWDAMKRNFERGLFDAGHRATELNGKPINRNCAQ